MTERDRLSDAEILDLLARGARSQAVACALRAFGPRILGYFVLVLRNDDAADEVYAQFCEDLWAGIETFRGEARFRTWAFQIAHNALCTYRKDPYVRRGRRLATAEIAALTAGVRTGTPLFQQTTVKSAIERLRERLEPDERALLALRVDQRLAWREVAQVMTADGNVNEAALRKRFERIKERLRELARDEGLFPPDDS